jgi:hypothetical protein
MLRMLAASASCGAPPARRPPAAGCGRPGRPPTPHPPHYRTGGSGSELLTAPKNPPLAAPVVTCGAVVSMRGRHPDGTLLPLVLGFLWCATPRVLCEERTTVALRPDLGHATWDIGVPRPTSLPRVHATDTPRPLRYLVPRMVLPVTA